MLLARRSIAHNNARIPLVLVFSLTDISVSLCLVKIMVTQLPCVIVVTELSIVKKRKKVYRHPIFVVNLINGTLNSVFR